MQLFTGSSLKNGLGFHLKQQQSDHSGKTVQTRSRTLTSARNQICYHRVKSTSNSIRHKKCRSFLASTTFKLFTDHRPLNRVTNVNLTMQVILEF